MSYPQIIKELEAPALLGRLKRKKEFNLAVANIKDCVSTVTGAGMLLDNYLLNHNLSVSSCRTIYHSLKHEIIVNSGQITRLNEFAILIGGKTSLRGWAARARHRGQGTQNKIELENQCQSPPPITW